MGELVDLLTKVYIYVYFSGEKTEFTAYSRLQPHWNRHLIQTLVPWRHDKRRQDPVAPFPKWKYGKSSPWRKILSVYRLFARFSVCMWSVISVWCDEKRLSPGGPLSRRKPCQPGNICARVCVRVCTVKLSKCSRLRRDPSTWLKPNTTPLLLLSFGLTLFRTNSHFLISICERQSLFFTPCWRQRIFHLFLAFLWHAHNKRPCSSLILTRRLFLFLHII